MTNSQSHDNGELGDVEMAWLERCAKGGFGTLITAAASISQCSKGFDGQLSLGSNIYIKKLKDLVIRLKPYKTVNILQICHPGLRAPRRLNDGNQSVAPSEIKLDFPNFEVPRALEYDEIKFIIRQFCATAVRAVEAGFDGIEILGANGYLVTQFISNITNKRTDDYGGALENRARFAREIVKECKMNTPHNFVVGMRLSAEGVGLDIDESRQIASWLVMDGVDYIHISSLNLKKRAEKYPECKKTVVDLFRETLGKAFPIIAAGGIQTFLDATDAIQHGAHLIALGRTAIGNPDWPNHVGNDRDYQPVIPPYSEEYLKSIGISDAFIGYIKKLPLKVIH